jgi:Secretion system C-terminal sorting domain
MKNILYVIIFLCALPLHCIAQKTDHTWVYGKDSNNPLVKFTQIKFDDDSIIYNFSSKDGFMGNTNSSTSDENGNLLMYSNGCHIFNKNGVIMKNGDSINSPINQYWLSECGGSNPSYNINEGFYVLPNPKNSYQYYCLQLRQDFLITGNPDFLYSVVDFSKDNGLGEVIEKDELLLSGSFEKSVAVKHGNGRDWWILISGNTPPVYYLFLLSDSGITGPYEQIEPLIFQDTIINNSSLRFSPDGKKLVHYRDRYGVLVYDFNRCTGKISNPVKIDLPDPKPNWWQGTDCEISSNSRYLYIVVQNFSRIVQYDLQSTNIPFSGDTVAVYDGFYSGSQPTVFGNMQLAPNGKIYITPGGCPYLHVINNPDLPGAACNVVQRGVQLPTWNYASMPYFPNYRLYDLPASPCDTLGIDTPISTIQQPDIPLVEGLLYPNPAQEQASLYLPGWQGAGRVTITDALGRVVLEQVVSRDRTTFQVRNWPSGVYAVLVWKEGRLVAAEQLVVQGN